MQVSSQIAGTSPITVKQTSAWIMLFSRIMMFTVFQAVFALFYWVAGKSGAWQSSAAWWPFTVIFTNIASVALLIKLFRKDGEAYGDLFHFQRQYVKKDILILVGFLVIGGPIAYLPNILVARGLFGNESLASGMMFQHLPLWASWVGFLIFPVSQGFGELAVYFGYVMPRLKRFTGSAVIAVVVCSLMLGIQHMAIPLLFDWRFIVYRMTMFIPFAFMVGILVNWRSSLFPYLAIIHGLVNFSASVFLLSA
jgi:hypothetical protein